MNLLYEVGTYPLCCTACAKKCEDGFAQILLLCVYGIVYVVDLVRLVVVSQCSQIVHALHKRELNDARVRSSRSQAAPTGRALLRAPAAKPMGYLHASSRRTARVLMLRSLNLPVEYADPAPEQDPGLDLPYCRFCHKTVHRDDEGQVSEAELRRRHICHCICRCPAIPTAAQARHGFRTAMSALALRSDMQLNVPLSVKC
jgi:hypothetical protein